MDKDNTHDSSQQAPRHPCNSCARGCPGSGNGCSRGCHRREPRGKLQAYDWLADLGEPHPDGTVQVMFKNTRTGFYSNPDNLDLKIGDLVVVEAQPGHDVGTVQMTGPLVDRQIRKASPKGESQLKRIYRKARPADLEKFEEARAREHDTMIRSRKIAEELGLDMKIGDVEYQGDGAKAIFYYIADERVDFRKLIRILADTFHIRVEMKQIGARQEAGRIGGIGPCGRPLCCSTWMSHFVSVGTGSARLQDLSMNPQKLAGQCAKLKCCLNFEVDAYAESQKKLPPKDVALETKDATYYYFKPDILTRRVTYSTDRNMPVNLVTIDARRAFEIMALNRNGVKVDSLLPEGEQAETQTEYVDLVGQDSLTRFDKSKSKARNSKKKPTQQTPTQQPRQRDNRDANPRQKTERRPKDDRQPPHSPKQRQQQKKRQPHPPQDNIQGAKKDNGNGTDQ